MPMPAPRESETEQEFISRFMADSEMLKDYPQQSQRSAVAYSTWRSNNLQNSTEAWPESYPFKFIEPGLVNYDDDGDEKGTILVKKGVLDKMAQSLVNKPVVNNDHRAVDPTDFSMGRADGIVTKVWYDADDGWFHGEMSIWDPETKENCKNGFSTSCAYTVKNWGSNGIHNNIPYDAEVLDGEYEHLAIVPNPRYEGATINLMRNSKGGSTMKLNFFKKQKEDDMQNAVEIDPEKTMVDVKDGKAVSISELISIHNSVEQKKKAEEALKNSQPSDDLMIPIGNGTMVTLKDLKNSYLKNAEEKEKEDKEKEKQNAMDKEEKEKEEKEKAENAMKEDHEDDEKGDHKENKVKNCPTCAKNKSDALHNAASNRKGDMSDLEIEDDFDKHSIDAKLKRGLERYGQPVESK